MLICHYLIVNLQCPAVALAKGDDSFLLTTPLRSITSYGGVKEKTEGSDLANHIVKLSRLKLNMILSDTTVFPQKYQF